MTSIKNIDELKKGWAKLSNDSLKESLSSAEVEQIVRKKSKSQIGKLKRNFLIECCISIPIFIAEFIYVNSHTGFIGSLMFNISMALVLFIFIMPMLKLFMIGKLGKQSIYQYLNKLVPVLYGIIRYYKIISSIFSPLLFCGGMITGISMASGGDFERITDIFSSWKGLVGFGGSGVLAALFGYFFIAFYIKIVYQKNVDNLNRFRLELEKSYTEEEA